MHRLWLIAELTTRIVEECIAVDVHVSDLTLVDRQTLCVLARTCQTLLEPALDLLWYRQYTFENLVKCLPRDLQATRVGAGGNETVR